MGCAPSSSCDPTLGRQQLRPYAGARLLTRVLDYLNFASETVAAEPLPARLPDEHDEPFLEVALACAADCLVTGNLAHFPDDARAGVAVLSPAEFIERYRAKIASGDS